MVPSDLLNGYKKQELTDTITHVYLVKTLTWASTDDAMKLLTNGKFSFPGLLYDNANVMAKLKTFKFLRADVQIEVRLNATPFHKGAIGVSWLPRVLPGGALEDAHCVSAYQRTAHNHELLSCSTNNSVTFVMERNAPRMQDEILDDGTVDDLIGTVWVDCIDPLQLAGSTGTPTDVSISIFASFKEPVVSGYGFTPSSAKHIKKLIKETTFKMKKQSKNSINQEAADKGKAGVISGILEAVKNFAPAIAASPFSEFAPVAEMAGLPAQFLKKLGYCKPVSVQSAQPVFDNTWADNNYTHGVSYGTKMAARPEAHLASVPYCGCKPNLISDYIRKPMMVYNHLIPYNATVDTPLFNFPVAPGLSAKEVEVGDVTYYPTPLAYLSQCFKNYRGGMKLYFRFITSQFVTTRVRISHYPSGNFPSSIEAESGDNVSAIVDVRGDTEYMLPVPYQGADTYKQVVGFYAIGDSNIGIPVQEDDSYIVVSLADKVVNPTPDGIAGVTVLVYAAAAEDMELNSFMGFNRRKTAFELTPVMDGNKIVLKKQSIEKIFKKNWTPIAGAKATMEAGFVSSEKLNTIEELLKRFTVADFADGTTFIPNNLRGAPLGGASPTISLDGGDTLCAIARTFMFYRGGIRYKLVLPIMDVGAPSPKTYQNRAFARLTLPAGDSHDVSMVDAADVQWTDLISVQYNLRGDSLQFEVPWMGSLPARPFYEDRETDFGTQERIYVKNWDQDTAMVVNTYGVSTTTGFLVYRALADDAELGIQIAPPFYEFEAVAEGLQNKKKEKEKESIVADIEQSVSSKRYDELLKMVQFSTSQGSPKISPTL